MWRKRRIAAPRKPSADALQIGAAGLVAALGAAARVRLRRRLLELIGLVALTLLADHLAGRKPADARALPFHRVG